MLEVFAAEIPTEVDKQMLFQKMMLIDQVATSVRADAEEKKRAQKVPPRK